MTLNPAEVPCISRDELGSLRELARGGQGKVATFASTPMALYATGYVDLLYKEYDGAALARLEPDVLRDMIRNAARIRDLGLGARLAWPLALVCVGQQVIGFVMQKAPDPFTMVLEMPRGRDRKLGELQFVLNGPDYTMQRRLPVTDRWRVGVLRSVGSMLASLHRQQIVVGDLSPKNLLASFRDEPGCFFLDCDAMQVSGRSALPQVETPGWELPNGELLATIHSDAFKFALLATRIFAESQESHDVTAIARFDPALGDLARRGLSTNPAARPPPADWAPALQTALVTASAVLPWLRPAPQVSGPPAAGHPPSGPPRYVPGPGVPVPGRGGRVPPASRRSPLIATVLTAVVLLVVVIVGLNLARSGSAANTPSDGGGSTSIAHAPEAPAPPPSLGTSLVSISAEAAMQPRAADVVALIDRHFTAINNRDYDTWQTTVVPQRATQQPPSSWMKAYRSTRDEQVSISAISDTGSGELDVGLTFISNQSVVDAPATLRVPRICWSTTWPVEETSAGLLLATPPSGSTDFKQC